MSYIEAEKGIYINTGEKMVMCDARDPVTNRWCQKFVRESIKYCSKHKPKKEEVPKEKKYNITKQDKEKADLESSKQLFDEHRQKIIEKSCIFSKDGTMLCGKRRKQGVIYCVDHMKKIHEDKSGIQLCSSNNGDGKKCINYAKPGELCVKHAKKQKVADMKKHYDDIQVISAEEDEEFEEDYYE